LGKRVMRKADIILDIHRHRGSRGLPLERVYKHLFDPELFFCAYAKIYRNAGAMTKGSTEETVDGMRLQKVHEIIARLKLGRYEWTPVRRTYIEKANGKMRPLGIPTWSDKLVQEVLRMLLEPFYESRFSPHSHGFRPGRSCHSALREIVEHWKGTVWFIEGDIKGCFDNIDHSVLLKIIRRDIHDDRLLRLIDGLLRAGYMEDWKHRDTTSGTPQGGILSPLLSNIYLNELDRFIEDTLGPLYTRGERRRESPAYSRTRWLLRQARKDGDREAVKRFRAERRKLLCSDPCDPDYRRLRYVRYADDFLLGFVGPGSEARNIRDRLGEFLERELKLTLSVEKTLITHAADDRARFLGYEIGVIRAGNLISKDGRRAKNGCITLLMPRDKLTSYHRRYSKRGKVIHRADLLNDTVYTIIQRYQGVLVGLYNYYCMASNVSKRMSRIKWVLQTSLLKTLAGKLKTKTSKVIEMYRVPDQESTTFRETITRPGKEPLVAMFGGMSLRQKPEGMGKDGFDDRRAWQRPADTRTEVVMHLRYGRCTLCGARGVEMHHIRKLADIDRPGRRPKERWERIMAARRRKSIPVCERCHDNIHAGRYDGTRLRNDELESRMR
jgi:group II intron reverse transcriptase/maturase